MVNRSALSKTVVAGVDGPAQDAEPVVELTDKMPSLNSTVQPGDKNALQVAHQGQKRTDRRVSGLPTIPKMDLSVLNRASISKRRGSTLVKHPQVAEFSDKMKEISTKVN